MRLKKNRIKAKNFVAWEKIAAAVMDIQKEREKNLHYQANYKSKQQHKKNVLSMEYKKSVFGSLDACGHFVINLISRKKTC